MDLNLNSNNTPADRVPQKRSDILNEALRSIDAQKFTRESAKEKRTAPRIALAAAAIALLVCGALLLRPSPAAPSQSALVAPETEPARDTSAQSADTDTVSVNAKIMWGEAFFLKEEAAFNSTPKEPTQIKNLTVYPDLYEAMEESEEDALFAVIVSVKDDYNPAAQITFLGMRAVSSEDSDEYRRALEGISGSPYREIEERILKTNIEFNKRFGELFRKYLELYGQRCTLSRIRMLLSDEFTDLKTRFFEQVSSLQREAAKLNAADHADVFASFGECGLQVLCACADEDCPDLPVFWGDLAVVLMTKDDLAALADTGIRASLSLAPKDYDLISIEDLMNAYGLKYFRQPFLDLPEGSKLTAGVSELLASGEEELTVMVQFDVIPGESDKRVNIYDAAKDRVLRESEILSYDPLVVESMTNKVVLWSGFWKLHRALPVKVSPERLRQIAEDDDVVIIALVEEYQNCFFGESKYYGIFNKDVEC